MESGLPLGNKTENGVVLQLGRPIYNSQSLDDNAYWLLSLDGQPHKRCINGKYLKHYHPSGWEGIEKPRGLPKDIEGNSENKDSVV